MFYIVLHYFIVFVNIIQDIYYNKSMENENTKPLKESVSITLDADLLQELRKEALREERSLSQFINIILKKYIKSINYED